jgi:hypothetical protein
MSTTDTTSWKETILQSLEQRDAREHLAFDVYDACNSFIISANPDTKLATLYSTLRAEGSQDTIPASPSSKSPLFTPFTPFPLFFNHSDDITTLKTQVAELYKTQNTHLQTIKSLETGLTSVQQAEKVLKEEYDPLT